MNRKNIGISLLVIAILLAILSCLAGYKSLSSHMAARYAFFTGLLSLFILIVGYIFAWRYASIASVLFRTLLVVILTLVVMFIFPDKDISNYLLIIIWSFFLIQGFYYKPLNRKRIGILFLIIGGLFFIGYFLFSTLFPFQMNALGMVIGLLGAGFLLLGLFYFSHKPQGIQITERPLMLYSVMLLTVLLGVPGLLYLFEGGLGHLLAALGWVSLLLFLEWLLYKFRHLRLVIFWALMFGAPVALLSFAEIIRQTLHNATLPSFPYLLLTILILLLLVFLGIFSPVGLMGIYRIPSFRDFKKYFFPTTIKGMKSKNEGEKINLKGVTLIELLIVVAIVAIISVGIVHLFGFTLLGSKHLELKNQAILLAESEMERLKSVSLSKYVTENKIPISEEGKMEIQNLPEGNISINITKYKNTSLKEIKITIQWYEGTRERSIQLTTLRGDEIS